MDNQGSSAWRPQLCSGLIQQTKVRNSIEIFHLDQIKIVRARNKIRLEVERQVSKIKNNQDTQAAKTKLRRMVKDTEILSRAAIVYLRMHRDVPEVKNILNLDQLHKFFK